MESSEIGFIQSPQSFYNHDLFQYNLYLEESAPNEQNFFFRYVQLARNREGYSREAEGYKAYAVSYMLCKRYGVDAQEYDISRLDGVLQGQDPKEVVPAALTDMRDTFKELNGRMARAMGLTRASRQKEQER